MENPNGEPYGEIISSSIEFADSSKRWLSGVPDAEGSDYLNWIRSGTQIDPALSFNSCGEPIAFNDAEMDEPEAYEGLLGGIIAPYILAAHSKLPSTGLFCEDNWPVAYDMEISQTWNGSDDWHNINGIDLVFTSDQSKWTRCPVVETQDNFDLAIGGVRKQRMRASQSVDKNGNPAPMGSGASSNPNDPNYIAEQGMGWFPGYAINVETGERLNMAFGEDSWMSIENGRDMKWNPTSHLYSQQGQPLLGGKHFIYIFRNTRNDLFSGLPPGQNNRQPAYDAGAWLSGKISNSNSVPEQRYGWRTCMWVMSPMVVPNQTLNACDVRIKLRVKKPYERYNSFGGALTAGGSLNNWYNMYEFSTSTLASKTNYMDGSYQDSILSLINVVPNPYYAYSAYETNKLDNRIKIVNLPDECTINIYNVSGSLIRNITKSTNAITSVDWDLKNSKGIPISGGVYLIHVEVPGVGERVLKWFGALRPTDLSNF